MVSALVLPEVDPHRDVDGVLAPRLRAFVGLGSNLGDRLRFITQAIAALSACNGITVIAQASVWESVPLGPAEFDFLNTAVELHTTLTPHGLLAVLQAIERDAGRSRELRWGPRTLDLDLLLMLDAGEVPLHSSHESLALPHPAILERDFVMEPLVELIPNFSLHERPLHEWLAELSAEKRTVIGRRSAGDTRAFVP